MSWYYNFEGQPSGPVSPEEMETLTRSGKVTPETLVWREGMPNWVPYATVAGTALAPPVALGAGRAMAPCVECGQMFAKDDMVAYDNSFVCVTCKPVFFQKLREGVATGAVGAMWRHKRALVTALNPTLPPRCVKCNEPIAAAQKKVNLYWHHPAIYLAVLMNILLYAIIAMLVRKRTVAMVSICPEHRAKRRNAILIAWALVLGGIVAFIAGAAQEMGWLMLAGGVAFFGGIIYGMMRGRLVFANKIDKERVWLSGCGERFLAEFPEWTGP
jgi:hypothetical protein